MNNLICVFFGHKRHAMIGQFASLVLDDYKIATFQLCSRCKKYYIYTLPKPVKEKQGK
jgi:hypothetical protein